MQLDQNKIAGTALLDLFKAFHCTPHDLLIAKLDIYGFNKEVLSFMYSHLKFRKQSVRINNKYNGFLELISGVSQGSILDALLFFEMACSCLLKKHHFIIMQTTTHHQLIHSTLTNSLTYLLKSLKPP